MKRKLTDHLLRWVVILILIVVLLPLLVAGLFKEETFLQVHHDALEWRNLVRVSFFGKVSEERIRWKQDGYDVIYQEIFGVRPAGDRWHTPLPIRTESGSFVSCRSPLRDVDASILRRKIVRGIYARYVADGSVENAKAAFRVLEGWLPGTGEIEQIGSEEFEEIERAIEEVPTLRGLAELGNASKAEGQ